ncbi:MAG: tail fiber protein [Cyclobacteriaceae bacterium]|nr:tail fiber protein [Cyclobacteriaceae bacterium]
MGGIFNIAIKGKLFTLGASDSEEKFQEFRSLIISESIFNISSEYYQTTYSSIPNTNLYEAFNQCIQTVCTENQFGFLPVKELITDDFAVFTIHYRPQVSTDAMPMVQFFKIENVSAVSNSPSIGQTLTQTTIISAKREPEKDIILTLQTDRGTVSRKIDGANSLSSNKEIPIGTILGSFLTFDEFNFASKNNAKSPGELWTSEKSKWAPCDGRSVIGSGYSKITSKSFVPDLRGMFLRGLNSFDPVKGPAPRIKSERDPEDRVAGQYQSDDLKSHAHNFVYLKPKSNSSKGGGANHEVSDSDQNNSGTTNETGGVETRPINVAVYYYIKIN